MIKAGKLCFRFAIQEPTETNTGGDVTLTWTTVSTVWGEFVSQSSREFQAAQANHAETTHVVRIRPYADLTCKHRLMHGSRLLNITGIENVNELNEQMLVTCTEER